MTINRTRCTLGGAIAAIGLVVAAASAAGAAAPPTSAPPTSEPSVTAGEPRDEFCAAGLVIAEAEAQLDDHRAGPDTVGPSIRQLRRAVERAAEVAPTELAELTDVAQVIRDMVDVYAANDFDLVAIHDDPAMAALTEAYARHDGVIDRTEQVIDEACAAILDDEERRVSAACAARQRLDAADDAFAEDRESTDPEVVERSWQTYVQAFDELRLLVPERVGRPLRDVRATFDRFEEIAIAHEWDYAAAIGDPAFESGVLAATDTEAYRAAVEALDAESAQCESGSASPSTSPGD